MPPSIFISHGAPQILLANQAAQAYLASIGGRHRLQGIIIASAHFARETPALAVAGIGTIAPATEELCRDASRLLTRDGIAHDLVRVAPRSHDLDHSAWLPLRLMFQTVSVPVALLSLKEGASPEEHFALGKSLSPLRDQGVLILGSGSLTHNFTEILPNAPAGTPTPWARQFVSWMNDRITEGDTAALLDYRQRAPHARRSHPTEEHLLPLFVAMGAGDPSTGRIAHDDFVFGTISLGAVEFS